MCALVATKHAVVYMCDHVMHICVCVCVGFFFGVTVVTGI